MKAEIMEILSYLLIDVGQAEAEAREHFSDPGWIVVFGNQRQEALEHAAHKLQVMILNARQADINKSFLSLEPLIKQVESLGEPSGIKTSMRDVVNCLKPEVHV